MEMTSVAAQSLAGLLAGRHWWIETALKPVMRRHDFATLGSLAIAAGQAGDGALAEEVIEALLNHETSFFRDPEPFRMLVGTGLDAMIRKRESERSLSLWSAGCATGQELYSLAMAIGGEPRRWAGWRVALTGTDISHRAIARATAGVYTHFEVQRGLPIAALVRSFDQEGDAWRIKPDLRRQTRFRQHNLLDPAPGERFDVILCRNVLLYFSAERQRQVLMRLREAIVPDGLLMLGAGETLPVDSTDFLPDPHLKGLYRPAA